VGPVFRIEENRQGDRLEYALGQALQLAEFVQLLVGKDGRLQLDLPGRFGRRLQETQQACGQAISKMLVARAIEEPLRWIATNAGLEGSIVVQKVREMKDSEGFNALTDTYEDLVKAGVIDPAKVVRSALQNSSSIASLLLTTEALISEIPEEKKDAPAMPGGGGGMGGMY
jgi:hypothetical protein